MTTRFCQDCGTAAEPGAGFCSSCGATLAAPPGEPRPLAAPPGEPRRVAGPADVGAARPAGAGDGLTGTVREALSGRRLVPLLLLATVAAVVVLAAGAIVLDRVGRPLPAPASTAPSAAAAPSGGAVASPATAPTLAPPSTGATGPAGSLPSVPASTPPAATQPPLASMPVGTASIAVGDTPIEAVAAFAEARGVRFAGACAGTNPVTDAGDYCSRLVDDRGAVQVFWIGPVGSEPEGWLLVAAGQYGWAVLDSAPMSDPAASPPF